MIGKLIKDAVRKEGWTIYRLAQKMGMSRNNLYVMLGKRGNPEWATIQKLLDKIGYEIVLRKKGGEKDGYKKVR